MERKELFAEYSLEDKKRIAENIFKECMEFPSYNLMNKCQNDFKICSLVGYKLATYFYAETTLRTEEKTWVERYFCISNERSPIEEPLWAPVRYCGINIEFGRVFVLNHCAFSSRDSIVGFRDSESACAQTNFRILKGLRHIGYYENWTLFKLDASSTDDMTGMLYSPLEKNFTIEFAHFPHDEGYRVLFRWMDC